jgi:hypothetical protein
MAILIPNSSVYGFTTDEYVKVSGVSIRENGLVFPDGSKQYLAHASLEHFTNASKEIKFKDSYVTVDYLAESELSLPQIYGKIMAMPEFSNASFA